MGAWNKKCAKQIVAKAIARGNAGGCRVFNVVTIAREYGSEGSDIDAEWPKCWVG